MSDLISKEALIEILKKYKFGAIINESAREYTRETVLNFVKEQPTIEAEPRWIPCSERLPKCNGCYLVWRPHFFGGEIGMPAICYFDGQDTWHDSYGVDFTRILNAKDVIAWMPLPEPYKGEQHETD